ncbi:phage antirepressor KilAC domain-containing protein [Streptomyces sp. XM4011]|uniref:phage antirepressor n=1 Tax=Streptomyces sp. XM4011 TaxID=2929780 RepID=UPI001FF9B641|nr:BRO family protein [Streptomyces sp. XM4011]MCK1813288.1 phage antirepressor KilAC domain-containing protein [Streptomyces sp. XM4011]
MLVDGEPWWAATDVARILGFRDAANAVRPLEPFEVGYSTVSTPGGEQRVRIVNESGLYALIFRSRREEAKRFRVWVTSEVIPAIRRTGRYEAGPSFPVPRSLPEALRAYAAEVEAHEETRLRVAELEPKAAVHDMFLAADGGDRLVRQVAKELGWREKDLRAFLLEEKVIYRRERACGDSEYDFYAAHAGRFTAVEKLVEHLWGACAHYTLYVTPAGMAFIQGRIDRRRREMQQAIGA